MSALTLKLVDLAKQYGAIGPDVDQAIRRVVQSGVFVGGDEVAQFEREWAAFCECRHAVGVANGTDALELVLRTLALPAGFGVLTRTWAAFRNSRIKRLIAKRVECGIHYPVPLHRQPAVEAIVGRGGVLPETDRASGQIVSVPMYPELSEADVDFVASELLDA